MTDPVTVMGDLSVTTIGAFAAGGVLLLGAFFSGVVSAIREWRTFSGKVTAIEAHVNSEKTEDKGKIATLTRENEILREMLDDRKATAALLAQAAAGSTPASVSSAAIAKLTDIETNTNETAVNTKRTDENVKDLKAQS